MYLYIIEWAFLVAWVSIRIRNEFVCVCACGMLEVYLRRSTVLWWARKKIKRVADYVRLQTLSCYYVHDDIHGNHNYYRSSHARDILIFCKCHLARTMRRAIKYNDLKNIGPIEWPYLGMRGFRAIKWQTNISHKQTRSN